MISVILVVVSVLMLRNKKVRQNGTLLYVRIKSFMVDLIISFCTYNKFRFNVTVLKNKNAFTKNYTLILTSPIHLRIGYMFGYM